MRRDVDVRALARGAAVAAVVAGVVAIVANLVDAGDDDGSAFAVPLLLVTLAGLLAGGWVAARACRRAPLAHGTGAAVAGVTVLLVVNLVRRLTGDDDIDAVYLVIWLLFAVACGLAGALVALRTAAPRVRRPFSRH